LISDRLGATTAVVAAAGAFSYAGGLIPSVAAQPRWDVIVAATMGGDLAQRLAVPYSGPAAPQGAAAVTSTPWTTATVSLQPVASLSPQPAPKGPWSTIVTGALPDEPVQARTPAGFKRVGENGEQLAQTAPAENAAAPNPAAAGAPAAAPGPAAAADPQPKPLEALPPDATAVQQYCFNTADPAADARFAWQAKKISDMEAELDKRAALLETKTEEFKTWLARRDEFSKKAQEKLVAFYTRMRPDAAALQLAAMDEETAAAVLTKIDSKVASAVMSEMEPARAAKLAGIISGASKIPRPKPPKPQADGAVPGKPRAEGGATTPAGTPADNGAALPQGRKS
jgi:flagellar motility protein MotE (MotC chaperone)